MASNLGSMQFEPSNLISINHGCEQQIKKDEILSKKKRRDKYLLITKKRKYLSLEKNEIK